MEPKAAVTSDGIASRLLRGPVDVAGCGIAKVVDPGMITETPYPGGAEGKPDGRAGIDETTGRALAPDRVAVRLTSGVKGTTVVRVPEGCVTTTVVDAELGINEVVSNAGTDVVTVVEGPATTIP